jgi:Outer membrane protein beta-barrel domain
MKPRSASSLFAAACVAAASAAHALPLSDRASFELFAGGNISTPGSYRGPMNVGGPDGPTTYPRLDFDDAYHHGYTGGAEFDYNFGSHVSAFARAAYSQFDGQNHEIGHLSSPTAGLVPIDARFGDADSRELDVGARYTFATGEKWRPFVGAALGAEHVSDTYAVVNNTRVALGKADTVFQQRLETGLQYSPMRNFDLRLTAAASHVNGGDASRDPNLSLLGLDSAHTGVQAHWDYPAEFGAVWHF